MISLRRCGIYVCTHIYIMEYYSVIKNDEILPSVTSWMDLKGMLSEMRGGMWEGGSRRRHMVDSC